MINGMINVVKTMSCLPPKWEWQSYHLLMVIWGMVHYCFTQIIYIYIYCNYTYIHFHFQHNMKMHFSAASECWPLLKCFPNQLMYLSVKKKVAFENHMEKYTVDLQLISWIFQLTWISNCHAYSNYWRIHVQELL